MKKGIKGYQDIEVELEGIKPIIFNRFVSIEEKNIPVEKKINIQKVDGKKRVGIDSNRIMAFLTASNPKTPAGCIKLFVDSRKYKKLLPKVEAYVGINPDFIPISDNDEYDVRRDKVGGGGVPQMVERPMVREWGAKFTISLYEQPHIKYNQLKQWFERGGIEVGLGAWRPRYGQFIVKKFDKIK